MTVAQSVPTGGWQVCSVPEHLHEVRRCHEDIARHLDTAGRGQVEALVAELASLFDHLDGLHADDVRVRLVEA